MRRVASKQEKTVMLVLALVGGAVAHKVASKQAAALGIPVLAVMAAGWALSQALA